MRASATRPAREIVIRPERERARLDPRELWSFRHLFRALVWRDVRIQFNDMSFGLLWPCVRPLLYVGVFAAFRKLSNAQTHVGIPYPLYLYSGLALWHYLLESIVQATGALRRDTALLTKVYYPRLITPAVPVVANLVGLGLALAPLAPIMLFYGVLPGWRLVLLPLVLFQCMALCLGVGLVFASLSLSSRDWERVLTNLLYIGMFVSPVVYAPGMIPDWARPAFLLNPAAGSLLAFRSALFSPEAFPSAQFLVSVLGSAAVLALGLHVFRSMESQLADRL